MADKPVGGEGQSRTENLSFDGVTPLIVVGPPRSGTRFVTAVLNAIPRVQLYSEIHDEILAPMKKSLRQAERVYDSSERDGSPAHWEARKRGLMYSVWHGLSADRQRPPRKKSLYIGYKTPFHEQHFEFYNRYFDPVRPVYICCIRSFVDHFLSVQARWPRHGIVYTAFRYIRSLRKIRRMKAERPDEVIVFVLDDCREQGYPYIRERLLRPLGLEEHPRARRLAERGAVNTAEKFGVDRADDLTLRQKVLLWLLPGTTRAFDALRRSA